MIAYNYIYAYIVIYDYTFLHLNFFPQVFNVMQGLGGQ